MLKKIKNKIDKELAVYMGGINRFYGLGRISPVLFSCIKDFIKRKGKRVRPVLFVVGYLGFAKKEAPGLYKSAVAIEIFHDFMLVHDDIIDKSQTRRGKPSMHAMLNRYLSGKGDIKFSGQDLTIVAGDVMYALAINAFFSVKEEPYRKEKALRRLIDAAVYTGSGEFVELLCGIKNIDKITKEDIYKIYDLKTANYTFSSPLSIGAILAGAPLKEVNKLSQYGMYLGRAFQIKDDILGIFGEESYTGKSNLTDLREGKKTILIWYAFHHTDKKEKLIIKSILTKRNIVKSDLFKVQNILINSGAINYAGKEIARLTEKSKILLESSKMLTRYKKLLEAFSGGLFNL
ncbi:MAG: polyprenyl synthetase family protein [Candidatus Omnitrophota bacterium]